MKFFPLLLIFQIIFSQENSTNLRYNYYGESPMVAISFKIDFMFKSTNNSVLFFDKKKKKSKDEYLFSEKTINGDLLLNVYKCIKNTKSLSFFYVKNQIDSVKIYYENHKHNVDFYVQLLDNEYLKFSTVRNKKIDCYNFNDKLIINFNKFFKDNRNKPSEIFKILDDYFYKDYYIQTNIIKNLINQTNDRTSLLHSLLIDIYTNDGSFEEVKDSITKRKKIQIDTTKVKNLDYFLLEKVKENDIIMFNEYHHYPHTRFNFMYVLDLLKQNGFKYLALETLPAPDKSEDIFIDINNVSGYYMDEQTCSLLVNYAYSIGFKLIAYEELEQCKDIKGMAGSNCRDSIQATNLSKLIEQDSTSKIVVFGGHAHIEKKSRYDWKFMRIKLQEMYPNKRIFSIGQTKYIRTNLDKEDFDFKKPIIYDEDDGQFDSHLISPFYNKYYEWYFKKNLFMTEPVKIDLNKEFYYIEIMPFYNNKIIFYPIFKCQKTKLINDTIFLPRNIPYKLIYRDINNKVL